MPLKSSPFLKLIEVGRLLKIDIFSFNFFLSYVGGSAIVPSSVVCQPDFRDSVCLMFGSCVTALCCNSFNQLK